MEKEKAVILRNFREYYQNTKIEVPWVERREFGVGGFRKKIESRHMGFTSNQALNNYLVQEVPLFISHSVAYYKFPESTPMERKEWMGGDLIFDLDVHGGLFLSNEEIESVKMMQLPCRRISLRRILGWKRKICCWYSPGAGGSTSMQMQKNSWRWEEKKGGK